MRGEPGAVCPPLLRSPPARAALDSSRNHTPRTRSTTYRVSHPTPAATHAPLLVFERGIRAWPRSLTSVTKAMSLGISKLSPHPHPIHPTQPHHHGATARCPRRRVQQSSVARVARRLVRGPQRASQLSRRGLTGRRVRRFCAGPSRRPSGVAWEAGHRQPRRE